VPFRSTVQLPFPENGASVTGISSPTFDRWVPHTGNHGRTSKKTPARKIVSLAGISDSVTLAGLAAPPPNAPKTDKK